MQVTELEQQKDQDLLAERFDQLVATHKCPIAQCPATIEDPKPHKSQLKSRNYFCYVC